MNAQKMVGRLLVALLIVCTGRVFGQQKPLFSQYYLNKYYENPAYGGLGRSLQADLVYRDAYSGFPGNPVSFYAGVHLPWYKASGGAGAQIIRFQSGLFQSFQFTGSYNYVMKVNPGFLSFGGRVGLHYMSYNGEQIITPEGNYEGGIFHNDPILATSPFQGFGAVWEVGAYLRNARWEAGVTIYDIPRHANALGQAVFTKSSGFSAYGEYTIVYGPYLLIPNVIFRSDFKELQTDIGLFVKTRESFFGGLGFRGYNSRSFDALIFTIGTNIGSHYKVSYAYDLGLSDWRNFQDGSHEIILSYNLNKAIGVGLPPKIIYNPRQL